MPKRKLLVLVTVLALAAVACGGDNTTPSAGGTTQSPGTSPQPTANPINNEGTIDATAMNGFSIELDDNYFKPTFIKAKPGQTLNIELESEGANPHTFTITALNINEELAAGAKKEINLTLSSGTSDIEFFCSIHGASGMRGAFFFGGAPSGLSTPPEQDPY